MSSTNPRARRRGSPSFAESQRSEILEMLRAAGPAGVSKAELIFTKHMSQCGARVFELEGMGYKIAHVQRDGEKYVWFVLESEPLDLKALDNSDWYTRATGKPRPASTESVSDLPLFSQGGS